MKCIVNIYIKEMPTDGCMDEENMVYVHNEALFSHRKEGNSDICYGMERPSRSIHDLTCMWNFKTTTITHKNQTPDIIDIEDRLVVGKGGVSVREKWVKRYKLESLNKSSHVVHSMVTRVNNNICMLENC